MLREEFDWYLDNQNSLVEQYSGKYLVISGQKVLFASDNKDVAYDKGVELAGLGKYILQRCTPGDEAYSITYHTHRVRFAHA
jgi:hypothetical protein